VDKEETMPKRTYTVLDVQNILDISRPTAYGLVKKNVFRSIRIGGQIRISKKSFDQWLDGSRKGEDSHEG
jgi:excisionase family DNA binding protein